MSAGQVVPMVVSSFVLGALITLGVVNEIGRRHNRAEMRSTEIHRGPIERRWRRARLSRFLTRHRRMIR